MAKTFIDLDAQGKALSVSNGLISATAAIATTKLADSANFLLGNASHTISDTVRYSYSTQQTFASGLNLVSKDYVDARAGGLDIHTAALRATTVANGNIALTGVISIDGTASATGERILVLHQTDPIENGVYVANDSGAWTRATDADAGQEIHNGFFISVTSGATLVGTQWVVTSTNPLTVGTSAIVFEVFFTPSSNAATLNGLASTDFARLTASSNLLTGNTLTVNSGAFLDFAATSGLKIGGTSVTASAAELNLLTGLTGTIWTSANDGSGSGLDADLLDGVSSGSFLRSDASDSVTTGVTLTIDSGAILDIASGGALKFAGTTITATAAQLNAVGTQVVRETPSGTPNGSLATFGLAHTPTAGTESVYVNGILQDSGSGNDYTMSGANIVFEAGSEPQTGSKVRASYRY